MKKQGVGIIRSTIVALAVVGCGKEARVAETAADAGADAGSCPEYEPNDAGVVLLMRGCPLPIDYAIR